MDVDTQLLTRIVEDGTEHEAHDAACLLCQLSDCGSDDDRIDAIMAFRRQIWQVAAATAIERYKASQ